MFSLLFLFYWNTMTPYKIVQISQKCGARYAFRVHAQSQKLNSSTHLAAVNPPLCCTKAANAVVKCDFNTLTKKKKECQELTFLNKFYQLCQRICIYIHFTGNLKKAGFAACVPWGRWGAGREGGGGSRCGPTLRCQKIIIQLDFKFMWIIFLTPGPHTHALSWR